MRFFSHEWAADEDAERAARVVSAYQLLLESLRPHPGDTLLAFTRQFDLRGAILDRIDSDSLAKKVQLQIFAGDLATGYKDLTITYGEAAVVAGSAQAFAAAAASRRAVIRYDEFDRADGGGRWLHRFLFWPKHFGEAEVSFSTVDWQIRPALPRQRSASGA